MADEGPTHPDTTALPEHPIRAALLQLFDATGTLTATEAGKRIGRSSGVCSFHLRRLAGAGLVEEVPHTRGRSRPWRLRLPAGHDRSHDPAAGRRAAPGEEFGALARGLEDLSWTRWQDHRELAPPDWRREEAFSAVIHLAPEELAEVAAEIRRVLARYQDREWRPSARPPGAAPVAALIRLFPLLPENDASGDIPGPRPAED